MLTNSDIRIAVDFDNTIAITQFPAIICEVPLAAVYLKKYIGMGFHVILNTCREDKYLDAALDFCDKAGILFSAVNENIDHSFPINARKVSADIYIDDRAIGCPLVKMSPTLHFVDWVQASMAIERMIDEKRARHESSTNESN